MAQPPTILYEGLFLLDQQAATDDLGACIEHLKEIMNRADAQVVAMKKWSERRLAYEIKRQKRGLFILIYFKAQTDKITGIERDCNLSETVLRNLIIRADHIGETELELINKEPDLLLEVKLREDPPQTPVTTTASETQEETAAPVEG